MKKVPMLFFVSLVFGTPNYSEAVALVRNGEPVSVIVTADRPSASVSEGAEDLQNWLRKSSGAIVPIKAESAIGKESTEGIILVGDTQRTRSLGINPDKFGLEEIVIQTFPQTLVIIGDDERPDGYPLKGTVLAVSAFADQILGIRLLWPGDLGEIVPRQSTIEIETVDIREKPVLVERSLRNLLYNKAIHSKIDALGWDHDQFRSMDGRADEWFRFHRIGGSFHGRYGHAFGDYWERFHEEHPDWFALQPDGTRDNSQPEHARYSSHRLCISNPGLIERAARDAIKKLKADPTLDCASVSPNDGGPQTFCLCKKCESWDAPEGKTIYMDSKEGRIPHVSLTDRFVRFYSEVAKIVAEEMPDRYIGAYAYHHYTEAPIHARLHPNVIIGFVPETKMYMNEAEREEVRENWLKWSEKAEHLFVRPNYLSGMHALPTVIVHRLAEDFRFYQDHKNLHTDLDCSYEHWATNGLNYYVAAKLLWNPYRDVDEIVEEYCVVGFGPAAKSIHRYFEEIERITNEIAVERRSPDSDTVARYYNDEILGGLNKILDEAERAAASDKIVPRRIAFLRQGLEYAPIC
ncbi:MAG: DUF4838 domain-containing protein, partial [bacterium]